MRNKQSREQIQAFLYNIAWLRKHYGISKKKMAELLGIGVGSLNKIEQGILPPRMSMEVVFHVFDHFHLMPSRQTVRLDENALHQALSETAAHYIKFLPSSSPLLQSCPSYATMNLQPSETEDNPMKKNSMIVSTIEQLRDPCVLVVDGVYYAYGTGWVCYKNTSGSLAGEWVPLGRVAEVPAAADKDHWAPEVHAYRGAYYMFTTYHSSETGHRGCTIMKSDSPEGPFCEITGGQITPHDWDAIDGTFYVDPDGQPWMIFVHEWTSTDDGVGRMAAAKLSDDLTHFVSEPVELFRADAPAWSRNKVTDGCWMYRCEDGQLLMLWSNWDSAGYCVGIARSVDGRVDGAWVQDEKLLYSKSMTGEYDGGHGMLFYDVDGQMYLSLHSPNNPAAGRKETPVFIPVKEQGGTLMWDVG